ncbi:MAG: hypothetical protein ACJ76S_10770 [Solirubrobacteraceae bacterium]
MGGERGQATVDWTALVLLVALALGAVTYVAAAIDAPWLGRALRCAVLAGCRGEDAELEAAYGADAAAYVRAYAPGIVYEPRTLTLPIDFRGCRSHRCSDAADLRGTDVWESTAGRHATVFTHVVDRRAGGGDLFVQYWLYYPDSTYLGPAYAASQALRGPLAYTPAGVISRVAAGHHADDWESYQVRIAGDGRVLARASAHHGYSGYRRWPNLNELPPSIPVRRTGAWTPVTGWTRVSRGSHAGHLVDGPSGERRTESNGVALVPIERLGERDRFGGFAIPPPWRKPVYRQPDRVDT